MFSLFRQHPVFRDATFVGLAQQLAADAPQPTFRRELLHADRLDYSLESLRVLDDYLEAVHVDLPADDTMMRLVLRAGAYAGEVIRRESRFTDYHWCAYRDAARHSTLLRTMGQQLGTTGLLWADKDTMCFPLSKVCQFIENGREESLYQFASLLVSNDLMTLLNGSASQRSESH